MSLLLLSLAQDQEEDQEELLVGDIFQALVCYGTTDTLITLSPLLMVACSVSSCGSSRGSSRRSSMDLSGSGSNMIVISSGPQGSGSKRLLVSSLAELHVVMTCIDTSYTSLPC